MSHTALNLGITVILSASQNPLRALRTSIYSAPPAQVSVPGELTREEYKCRFMEEDNFDVTFRCGWNACRAANLQGSQPVSNRDELPPQQQVE